MKDNKIKYEVATLDNRVKDNRVTIGFLEVIRDGYEVWFFSNVPKSAKNRREMQDQTKHREITNMDLADFKDKKNFEEKDPYRMIFDGLKRLGFESLPDYDFFRKSMTGFVTIEYIKAAIEYARKTTQKYETPSTNVPFLSRKSGENVEGSPVDYSREDNGEDIKTSLEFADEVQKRVDEGRYYSAQRLRLVADFAEEFRNLSYYDLKEGVKILKERGVLMTLSGTGNIVNPNYRKQQNQNTPS